MVEEEEEEGEVTEMRSFVLTAWREVLCPSTIPCARDSQKRDMPELRKERVSWMKTGEMTVSSEEAGDGEEAGEDVRKESY
jgi:hypothetical protein